MIWVLQLKGSVAFQDEMNDLYMFMDRTIDGSDSETDIEYPSYRHSSHTVYWIVIEELKNWRTQRLKVRKVWYSVWRLIFSALDITCWYIESWYLMPWISPSVFEFIYIYIYFCKFDAFTSYMYVIYYTFQMYSGHTWTGTREYW